MKKGVKISIIAAIGKNRELGKNNSLLWKIPDDLKRFKALSSNHPVILGRKTFESIVGYLGKPLPNRTNIVVTRDTSYDPRYPDVIVAHSFEEALDHAKKIDQEEIHIGGGSDVYAQALPYTTNLHLTLIDDTQDADTFFPPYESEFTKETFREEHETSDGLKYTWIDLERE